jgi:hypothetical protein
VGLLLNYFRKDWKSMKNRYLAIMLGLIMTMAPCTAFAQETELAGDAGVVTDAAPDGGQEMMPGAGQMEDAQENAIYGKITAIGETSVTIAVGTQDPTQPSELELTGEELTVGITEDTVITRGGMGMGGQMGGGNGQMGGAPGQDGGEAPEKPDGETGEMMEQPNGDGSENGGQPDMADGEVPEKPDGDGSENGGQSMTDGEVPEKPDGDGGENVGQPDMGQMGEAEALSISDLAEDDIIAVVLDEDGNARTITVQSADMGGQMGGDMMGGMSAADLDYTAVNEYTEDTEVEDETITSTGSDENAVLVSNGANVALDDVTVDRTSSDSTGGDNSSFYGVGAAVLATDGTLSVSDSTITTDSAGGAGVFAYGDATVYVEDTTITTQQNTSGGIHAAGGGTLYAWDLDVTTNGESAAAIRSDRGGGTMVIDDGSYTSNGVGSPAVYCTADIAINDADLTATGSEAVCIEGLNTLNLFDCDLSGTMSDSSQNDCTWTVIVYQSMSGDSEIGNGTFTMSGGTLTSGNGGLFYTTNTECTMTLKDVEIQPSDTNAFFLRCTGNNNQRGWGNSGANGSDCLFTAIEQQMEGDVIWDSISQLDFYMTDGSSLTGAVTDDESFAGNGGNGFANLYIDETSTWTVTGDSTLTALYNAGTITDAQGNTVSVVGVDGTEYVSGDSEYTITVETYSDSADVSGASTIGTWEDYEVEDI